MTKEELKAKISELAGNMESVEQLAQELYELAPSFLFKDFAQEAPWADISNDSRYLFVQAIRSIYQQGMNDLNDLHKLASDPSYLSPLLPLGEPRLEQNEGKTDAI